MTYVGHCACGAVSATISAEPVGVRQCWCRQCQQIAAGGPTNNAIFPTDAVKIEGKLAHHGYTAASGNTIEQHFCPACGTAVMGTSSARPHFRAFRLGFLEAGHGLKPDGAIWTDEAPDWAVIDPALEQVPNQPPAPPAPGD
jgi:hypothetical protein